MQDVFGLFDGQGNLEERTEQYFLYCAVSGPRT